MTAIPIDQLLGEWDGNGTPLFLAELPQELPILVVEFRGQTYACLPIPVKDLRTSERAWPAGSVRQQVTDPHRLRTGPPGWSSVHHCTVTWPTEDRGVGATVQVYYRREPDTARVLWVRGEPEALS